MASVAGIADTCEQRVINSALQAFYEFIRRCRGADGSKVELRMRAEKIFVSGQPHGNRLMGRRIPKAAF